MATIIGIFLLILGFIFLGIISLFIIGAIGLIPLKIAYWKELRRKGTARLREEVFHFADSYFGYIGNDNRAVEEFKNLIKAADLYGIKRNWRRLSSNFRTLERKAGHSGRPLIFDYYCWYEMAVIELIRRIKKSD